MQQFQCSDVQCKGRCLLRRRYAELLHKAFAVRYRKHMVGRSIGRCGLRNGKCFARKRLRSHSETDKYFHIIHTLVIASSAIQVHCKFESTNRPTAPKTLLSAPQMNQIAIVVDKFRYIYLICFFFLWLEYDTVNCKSNSNMLTAWQCNYGWCCCCCWPETQCCFTCERMFALKFNSNVLQNSQTNRTAEIVQMHPNHILYRIHWHTNSMTVLMFIHMVLTCDTQRHWKQFSLMKCVDEIKANNNLLGCLLLFLLRLCCAGGWW